MEPPAYQKVHITSVGFEIDRVVIPIVRIGADRVFIVTNVKEAGVYQEVIEEVERQLRLKLRGVRIDREPLNIFSMPDLMSRIGKIIRRERERRNTVFVNIAVGTRVFGAAGYLAAVMFGAVPFYAEVEEYRIDTRRLRDRHGRPLGISKGVKDIHFLPQPPIEYPPEHQVAMLCILDAVGGQAKESDVIARLGEVGLMMDVWEGKTIAKSARSSFLRRYYDPMRERGWIEHEGRRRSAAIRLTEKGRELVKVFGPVLSESLYRAGEPAWEERDPGLPEPP